MCIGMYVYMYVVCKCIGVYIYVCVCVCTCTKINTCIYTDVCVSMYENKYIRIYIYIYIYTEFCVCVCVSFRRVRKIAKSDHYLNHVCLSICPSIRWNNSTPTRRIFMKFRIFMKTCPENSKFVKI
jgi:hypothetical protein